MKMFSIVCALIGLGVIGETGGVDPAPSAKAQSQEGPSSRRDPLSTLVLEEGTPTTPIPNLGKPVAMSSGATATIVASTHAWRRVSKKETVYRLRLDIDVEMSIRPDWTLPHIQFELEEGEIGRFIEFIDAFAEIERLPRDPIFDYEQLDASWGDLDFRSSGGSILLSWSGFELPGRGWLPIDLDVLKKGLGDGRALIEKLKTAKPSARF